MLFINNFEIELNVLIQNVTHLNLESCKLGDDHDFLRNVLQICPVIESLNLAQNNLSGKGLRNLFRSTHLNVQTNLKYLDISNNANITSSGILNYVEPVKSIISLILSVDFGDSLLPAFERKSRPEIIFVDENKGWGSELIDSWQAELKILEDNKKKKIRDNFYSKANATVPLDKTDGKKSKSKIMFQRVATKMPSPKRRKLNPDNDDSFDDILSLYQ